MIGGVYLGFGSNLGDRESFWRSAQRLLKEHGYVVSRLSPLYESEPWGGAEGGNFLNGVIELVPRATAVELLEVLQRIEELLGRTRPTKLAARSCDLDLLLWQAEIISTELLTVPHPRISQRRFVLRPLCDLIPDVLHPVLKVSFASILDSCSDFNRVWPYHSLSAPFS